MPWLSRKSLLSWLALVLTATLLLFGLLWSGIYDVGADAPHARPVLAMMETLRDRSIAVRADRVSVPDLDDPARVLEGAGHYAAMCAGCHLGPGAEESELRRGLYPQPPDLSRSRVDPQVAFWVIKHGIKMSAMPAWGFTHDDRAVWSMVAFLQQLPELTSEEYRALVAKAPPDEDMEEGGHHHDGGVEAHHGSPAAHDHADQETPSHAHDEGM